MHIALYEYASTSVTRDRGPRRGLPLGRTKKARPGKGHTCHDGQQGGEQHGGRRHTTPYPHTMYATLWKNGQPSFRRGGALLSNLQIYHGTITLFVVCEHNRLADVARGCATYFGQSTAAQPIVPGGAKQITETGGVSAEERSRQDADAQAGRLLRMWRNRQERSL